MVVAAAHSIALIYLLMNMGRFNRQSITLVQPFVKYGLRTNKNELVWTDDIKGIELNKDSICVSSNQTLLRKGRVGGGVGWGESDFVKQMVTRYGAPLDLVEVPVIHVLQSVDGMVAWLLVLFELITVYFAVSRYMGARKFQRSEFDVSLQEDSVWIGYYEEYAVTSGLLAVAVAIIVGMRDLSTLACFYVLMAACNILGLVADYVFTEVTRSVTHCTPRWKSEFDRVYAIRVAFIVHALAWAALVVVLWPIAATFALQKEACPNITYSAPDFVGTIVAIEVVLFVLFGVVAAGANYMRLYGTPTNSVYVFSAQLALCFETLSIVAKLGIVVILATGSAMFGE